MKSYRHRLAPLSSAIMLVLIVATWVAFAPVQVGGQASYVIVNGNSMEPRLHKGDLAIVHEAETYRPGDVVTYRHPDIGPIIHRIIRQDGDRFVFKGDNNSWLDSYLPVESELVGKLWMRVPFVGKFIGQLRNPGSMALFSGVMGVIAMTTIVGTNTTKDGHKRSRRVQSPTDKGAGSARTRNESGQGIVTLLVTVMLASVVLGVFAFGRPAQRAVSADIGYEQMGEFSYSAPVPAGVYDMDEVKTGEPVFRRLTKTVDVSFDYRFTSEQPSAVEGSYRLIAEVSDPNGWKRMIQLQPDTGFRGNGFTATGVLDLAQVQALINRMEKQTGFHSDQYTVAVRPEVFARGTLAGKEVRGEFSPELNFWLDPLQLQLESPNTGVEDPLQSSSDTDPLKPSKAGYVKHSHTELNTLSLLGLDLGVPMARLLSLLGLALSLGGLAWCGLVVLRALRGGEPSRIQLRYGPLLVSMSGGDIRAGARVVEVSTFEDLVKLAEKGGQSILYQISDNAHEYYVHEADLTYCYRAADQEPDNMFPEDMFSTTKVRR